MTEHSIFITTSLPVSPNIIIFVFLTFICISSLLTHHTSWSEANCNFFSTSSGFAPAAKATKSSANLGEIHLGTSCKYVTNNSGPCCIPADVPISESVHWPNILFILSLACLWSRKLRTCKKSFPDIPKSLPNLYNRRCLLTLPKASDRLKNSSNCLTFMMLFSMLSTKVIRAWVVLLLLKYANWLTSNFIESRIEIYHLSLKAGFFVG